MAQALSLHTLAFSNEVCMKDTTNNAELQGVLTLLQQHRRGDDGRRGICA